MSINIIALINAGHRLYGEDWQRPLARGLGPLHPAGPRDAIDDRLVRRWATRERPIPDWVGPALVRLLNEEARRHLDEARGCRMHAEELEAFLKAKLPVVVELELDDGPATRI